MHSTNEKLYVMPTAPATHITSAMESALTKVPTKASVQMAPKLWKKGRGRMLKPDSKMMGGSSTFSRTGVRRGAEGAEAAYCARAHAPGKRTPP